MLSNKDKYCEIIKKRYKKYSWKSLWQTYKITDVREQRLIKMYLMPKVRSYIISKCANTGEQLPPYNYNFIVTCIDEYFNTFGGK